MIYNGDRTRGELITDVEKVFEYCQKCVGGKHLKVTDLLYIGDGELEALENAMTVVSEFAVNLNKDTR